MKRDPRLLLVLCGGMVVFGVIGLVGYIVSTLTRPEPPPGLLALVSSIVGYLTGALTGLLAERASNGPGPPPPLP